MTASNVDTKIGFDLIQLLKIDEIWMHYKRSLGSIKLLSAFLNKLIKQYIS